MGEGGYFVLGERKKTRVGANGGWGGWWGGGYGVGKGATGPFDRSVGHALRGEREGWGEDVNSVPGKSLPEKRQGRSGNRFQTKPASKRNGI